MEYAQQNLGVSVNDSYHFAFGVACVSLIISMAIYYSSRRTFKHVEGNIKQTSAGKETAKVEELSPRETKDRIIAHLFLDGIPPKRTYPDLFCR